MAVLLAWDAETATGRPRVPNETVAAACREYPDAFTGLGLGRPAQGRVGGRRGRRASPSSGCAGVKFHPSLQAFAPDDPKYWPVFAACERHGLLALFHTGTSGIGARQPGGQGIRIDYAHPLKLDAVAAAHPGTDRGGGALRLAVAHGPDRDGAAQDQRLHRHLRLVAASGSRRRSIRELKGRLSGQFLWGSDFPFIAPERCLAELDELGLASPALLRDNAARVLGLPDPA